nr:E3 ubiquitin-protein ligase NRDP1-like isoform X2 [Crassostrea virginica]XP_022326009.1 E3 ubiquitin-protein ligase NRDP1-like isoform X2 [Crassostrea virginica]
MGYEINRFRQEVNKEFICPICQGVLENPQQVSECEHAFCKACIDEWLKRQPTCPVDRKRISPKDLKPVPRILTNLLSNLEIACDNANYGCTTVVKLEKLPEHLRECYHSQTPVQCTKGCGITVPKYKSKDHNCVLDLRSIVEQQASSIAKMQSEINSLKASGITEMQTELTEMMVSGLSHMQTEITDHTSGIRFLKECMRSMVGSNPQTRLQFMLENEDFLRSLETARVTQWGSMISTPNDDMLEGIKSSLTENGCPLHLATELIEKATEKHWPSGLSSLDARQLNREQCEKYVAKRIPGKQAVLVLACDNNHVPENLIMDPGLVMIFSRGVE